VARQTVREVFRAPQGTIDLAGLDPAGQPVGPRDKAAAGEELAHIGKRLDELQEALYAEATGGGTRRVLLVLQGLDTSGKGGVIRHVAGMVNPQGLHIASFKKPTPEELAHHFLWRIRKQVPTAGRIGVFDRSHYEEVLVARVRELVPRATWSRRYATINRFEDGLANDGTTIIKCFLHISFAEWRERQLARLDDRTKHWKFNPGDVDDAVRWNEYLDAYNDALSRCNTDAGPWYVIPADRKWHRNLAVTRLLVEHLERLDLAWPPATFDVEEQRKRVEALEPGSG
jgi:PPK2 family polyphosphate:nucleotide phosphotransferase